MFKVYVDYPSYDEEYVIADVTTGEGLAQVKQVLDAKDIIRMQQLVRRVPAAPHLIHYALRMVRATRVLEADCPEFVKEHVSWGSGPRGVQYLLLGAKARAAINGRTFATTDDVRAVAKPVLRHRIITSFTAESSGITSDKVVEHLLKTLPDRMDGDVVAPELVPAFA